MGLSGLSGLSGVSAPGEAWRGDEGVARRGVPTKLELSTLLLVRVRVRFRA